MWLPLTDQRITVHETVEPEFHPTGWIPDWRFSPDGRFLFMIRERPARVLERFDLQARRTRWFELSLSRLWIEQGSDSLVDTVWSR